MAITSKLQEDCLNKKLLADYLSYDFIVYLHAWYCLSDKMLAKPKINLLCNTDLSSPSVDIIFAEQSALDKTITLIANYYGLLGCMSPLPLIALSLFNKHQDIAELISGFFQKVHQRFYHFFYQSYVASNPIFQYDHQSNELIKLVTTLSGIKKITADACVASKYKSLDGMLPRLRNLLPTNKWTLQTTGYRWESLSYQATLGYQALKLADNSLLGKRSLRNNNVLLTVFLSPEQSLMPKVVKICVETLQKMLSLYLGKQIKWTMEFIIPDKLTANLRLGYNITLGWLSWLGMSKQVARMERSGIRETNLRT